MLEKPLGWLGGDSGAFPTAKYKTLKSEWLRWYLVHDARLLAWWRKIKTRARGGWQVALKLAGNVVAEAQE